MNLPCGIPELKKVVNHFKTSAMKTSAAKSGKKKEERFVKSLKMKKMITKENEDKNAFEVSPETGGNHDDCDKWIWAEGEFKGSFR